MAGKLTQIRVALLCDYGAELGRLVPVLRKLDGKQLQISLHTGPY